MANSTIITTTCYRPYPNGTIQSFYSDFHTPKTDTQYSPCCFGSSAYTVDNVCYLENHSQGSGYYMGLCTDPTYKDPSCARACVSYTKGDIVYTDNKWLCCGADSNGDPACSNPTAETVNGIPAPKVLQAVLSRSSISSSSTASVTSSATSSSQVQATSSLPSSSTSSSGQPRPTSSSTSGLSTGAEAGIGVGVALMFISLIALAAYIFMRRSRHSHGVERLPIMAKHGPVMPVEYQQTGMEGSSTIYKEGYIKHEPVAAAPSELVSSPAYQQHPQRIHEMG